ncbi:hypothetical protein B0T22DRAFT_112087 [Podospora appendiculata]|uniref:Uncharacterized protein n=1 Tax=Podospora appendiculata TaxID=314037 RepID=A0AAE0XLM1_9PEZI|nr:hypothetical protein B0T22DRAFT_112087 [Podospora appendiculata]
MADDAPELFSRRMGALKSRLCSRTTFHWTYFHRGPDPLQLIHLLVSSAPRTLGQNSAISRAGREAPFGGLSPWHGAVQSASSETEPPGCPCSAFPHSVEPWTAIQALLSRLTLMVWNPEATAMLSTGSPMCVKRQTKNGYGLVLLVFEVAAGQLPRYHLDSVGGTEGCNHGREPRTCRLTHHLIAACIVCRLLAFRLIPSLLRIRPLIG